jgi:hypothetical protein
MEQLGIPIFLVIDIPDIQKILLKPETGKEIELDK